MNAIVLAAGFGIRVGNGSPTCKAFMRIGRRNAIDMVIDAVRCPSVRTIYVVHNDAHKELFKTWKGTILDNSIDGLPYVRLHNDHAKSASNRHGAIGSMHSLLQNLDVSLGAVLAFVDTAWTFSMEHMIHESRGDATICLQRMSLVRSPESYGCVDVDDTTSSITNFYEKRIGSGCSHVFLGPVVFAPSVREHVREYVEEQRALGRLPDNVGDFISWLVARRADVRGWVPPDTSAVWDLTDRESCMNAAASR